MAKCKTQKNRMTPDRKRHMQVILDRFNEEYPVKYRNGQLEHGGRLEERCGLYEAEREVLDLWSYIQIERHKKEVLVNVLLSYAEGNIKPEEALSVISSAYVWCDHSNCSHLTPKKPSRKNKA